MFIEMKSTREDDDLENGDLGTDREQYLIKQTDAIMTIRLYCFSMKIFLFLLLLTLVCSGNINAIESDWPFQIDYMLLISEVQNSYPSAFDGTTVVISENFNQQLPSPPSQILLVLSDYFLKENSTSLKYSFLAKDISRTGFQIAANFNAVIHKKIKISFMTIFPDYGVELLFGELSSLDQSTPDIKAADIKYRLSIRTSLTFQTDIGGNTPSFVAPFISSVFIENYGFLDVYKVSTSFSDQTIKMQLTIPKASTLNNITIELFVYSPIFSSNALSQFNSYHFECGTRTGYTQTENLVFENTNQSATIYFVGGIITGYLSRTYYFGHQFDVHSANSLLSRPPGSNSIYIEMEEAAPANVFGFVWMYRTNCSNPYYPYLMMNVQKCYASCPSYHYASSDRKCNLCSDCADILECNDCIHSMCLEGQYYDHDSRLCESCSQISDECETCLKGQCTKCEETANVILIGGNCVNKPANDPINGNEGNNSKDQEDSSSEDSSGRQSNQEEEQDQEQTINNKVSIILQAFVSSKAINTIVAFISFNSSLKDIQDGIEVMWFVNGEQRNAQLTYFYHNNTIKGEIAIDRSLNSPTVRVKIVPYAYLSFEKTEDQQTVDSIYFIHPQQQALVDFIGQATGGISDSSGLIMSTASLSSLSGYIVGIFWNFQIASYYLFLPVAKPLNLFQLLNATTDILNINILPFSIPSPLDNDDTEVKGLEIYAQFSIDLYFMRASFEDIISLAVFSLFYFLLFLLFRNFEPHLFITRFVKTKIVDQVYVNISMNFYSLITVLAFVGSTALTSRKYANTQLLLNNLQAYLGLFVVFFFTILHPTVLYFQKQTDSWDTQDCYFGLKREKKHSQLLLIFLLLSQLIIPITIPLLHPLLTLFVITNLSILNIVFLLKFQPIKFSICIYYRIISQLSFILFNLTFAAYYFIEHYFQVDISVIENIGYVSIGSMALVIILQMVEMVTEMAIDCFCFIRKAFRKMRLKQMINENRNIAEQNIQNTPKVIIRKSEFSKRKRSKSKPKTSDSTKADMICSNGQFIFNQITNNQHSPFRKASRRQMHSYLNHKRNTKQVSDENQNLKQNNTYLNVVDFRKINHRRTHDVTSKVRDKSFRAQKKSEIVQVIKQNRRETNQREDDQCDVYQI